MAWSMTALGSANSTLANTAYSTGSYTPTANRLLVAIVGGSDDAGETWAAPTLAGNGVAWTNIIEGASVTDRGVALFAAKSGASPSTGALTATFGDNQTGCDISVFEIDGADISGTASQAFIQAKYDATGSSVSSFSITLDAAPAASSRCVAGFTALTTDVALTPRTNWTEIHDIGYNTPTCHLISEWRSDASEQTASASTTGGSTQTWRGLVAEMASSDRTGTGASTLAGVTSAGTGAYTPAAITGTGASTLAGVTSEGTGVFTGTGPPPSPGRGCCGGRRRCCRRDRVSA